MAAAGVDANSSGGAKPVLTQAAENAGERAVAGERAPTVQESVDAFWTSERMREATPVDESPALRKLMDAHKKTARDDAIRAGKRTRAPKPDGPEGIVEAAQPESDSPALAVGASASRKARAAATPSSYPYYSFPARTAGKVFFTDTRNGRNYVCSGTIINSEGKNSVWTAGHCVHGGSGGNWHANWAFVPSYQNGSRPYGTWTARQLWSKNNWTNSSEWASDIGVAVMNTLNGWRIADYLGGQGITWNRSKRTPVTAFGYPADAPFNGSRLYTCAGTTFPEWEFLWVSSETLGLVCDMTGGSSGGGWLASFNGTTGYLDGNNSFKYTNDSSRMYSPYYDDTASTLYGTTRGL